jgi:hypothetical protein
MSKYHSAEIWENIAEIWEKFNFCCGDMGKYVKNHKCGDMGKYRGDMKFPQFDRYIGQTPIKNLYIPRSKFLIRVPVIRDE